MMLEFTLDNWEHHPCVKGRPAVERDVRENRAIFTTAGTGAHAVAPVDCPLPAVLTRANGDRISVIILQAQWSADRKGYVFGAVDQSGKPYVATSSETLILKQPTPEWTANLETSK
jgi:hypothetical protein